MNGHDTGPKPRVSGHKPHHESKLRRVHSDKVRTHAVCMANDPRAPVDTAPRYLFPLRFNLPCALHKYVHYSPVTASRFRVHRARTCG